MTVYDETEFTLTGGEVQLIRRAAHALENRTDTWFPDWVIPTLRQVADRADPPTDPKPISPPVDPGVSR